MSEPGTGFSGDWWTFIIDREARVVWARETQRLRVTMHPHPSYDETSFLIAENSYWATCDGDDGEIVRMKIDGTIEDTYATPGLHHPFTETADGALLWAAYDGRDDSIEELSADGSRRTIFSCDDWHDDENFRESCGSNTIFWHEPTDSILFSFFYTDTIVHLDRQNGEVFKWFGELDGSWDFDPPSSQFWYQHGAQFLDDGHLLVSTHVSRNGNETVVREYELDESAETLREVWNFGVGEGVWGAQMGEAYRLPNGNTLHNYGTDARVREATPDREVVWEVDWSDSSYIGRTTPIGDLYQFAP
jgi:hypothetical protein